MEKVNLKRVFKIISPEDVETIKKHKINMLELEKTSSGEERDAIQKEIYDCKVFLRKVYKRKVIERKRQEEIERMQGTVIIPSPSSRFYLGPLE